MLLFLTMFLTTPFPANAAMLDVDIPLLAFKGYLMSMMVFGLVIMVQLSYSTWGDETTRERHNFFGSALIERIEPVTVVKCSIAFDVSDRDDPSSILSVLDRLAITAKADRRQDDVRLTKQVAMDLLRRKAKIRSASGTVLRYRHRKEAQRTYNQWCVQEQSKFEQDMNNMFGKSDLPATKRKDTNHNLKMTASTPTMAVVTLILSVKGLNRIHNNKWKWKDMPMIHSRSDLIALLEAIAGMDETFTSTELSSQQLLGVKIIWIPKDRLGMLTDEDMIENYPELTVL
jgi:uncharacterized membrane protein